MTNFRSPAIHATSAPAMESSASVQAAPLLVPSLALALKLWRDGSRQHAMRMLHTLIKHAQASHEVFNNLGFMLLHTDRLDDAEAMLRRALGMHPHYWEAWLNLALVHVRKENQEDAEQAFMCAEQFGGNQTLPWIEHARYCVANDAPASAVDILATGLQVQSPRLDLLLPMFDMQVQKKDWLSASELVRRHQQALLEHPHIVHELQQRDRPCLDALPDSESLCIALASVAQQFGLWDAALYKYQCVLQVCRHHLEALRGLGCIYSQSGRLTEALGVYEAVLASAPDDWRAWNDGGCILRAMGRCEEALHWMLSGAKRNPDNATLPANAALLSYELHDYDQAQVLVDRTFAIAPDYAEALHTQAMLLSSLGRHHEAAIIDRKVLGLKPDYPQARMSLALSELTLGRWKTGFQGYEHRWVGSDKANQQVKPTLGRALWLGTEVYPGSCIAVLPEQGFGDHFQFARFIPSLLDRFHRVEWAVPSDLLMILQKSFSGNPRVRISADPHALDVQRIDYEIPLMSLPLALGVTVETLKPITGYLSADPGMRRQWADRLQSTPGLKVGLAWAGRPTLSKHALRMVPPDQLEALDQPGITFVNLHKSSPGLEQLPSMRSWIDWMPECVNFADTAALIDCLDVVIATDTAVVHLAAALGKPVFLMNRVGSEWRWLDQRRDSPWYPTMTIYNQQSFKDWTTVLLNIGRDLERLVKQRKGNSK